MIVKGTSAKLKYLPTLADKIQNKSTLNSLTRAARLEELRNSGYSDMLNAIRLTSTGL